MNKSDIKFTSIPSSSKSGSSNNRHRDTVGKISSELIQKEPDTRDPIELEREMHKEYEKNLIETLEEGKKRYPSDFYLVVLTKTERLMINVIRDYFFSRLSCPTPEYDQVVYKYHKKDDILEFLWVIPSKDACIHLRNNAILVDKSERDLLNFVLDFFDGTLDRKAKLLNNETYDYPYLLNKVIS